MNPQILPAIAAVFDSPARPATSGKLPSLDGLRGLAILLVLGHNVSPFEGAHAPLALGLERFFNLGWVGVQLFFVLSGFLITRILIATQDAADPLRSFFGRRVLRIFPLYFASLFFFFVVLPMVGAQPAELRDDKSWPLWLYLSNWTGPLGLGGDSLPHFWSLAVEEQFYLVWPFLLYRRTPAQVLKISLAVAALAVVARIALLSLGVDHEAVYEFTISRMDALALGSAAAALLAMPAWRARLLERRRQLWWAALALAMIGLLVTRGFPRASEAEQTYGYTLVALTCVCIMLAAALSDGRPLPPQRSRTPFLQAGWLTTLGKYSYAIYVFHRPLHAFVGRPIMQSLQMYQSNLLLPSLAYVAAILAASAALAYVSYHLLEAPFLALKDRWFASGAYPTGDVLVARELR